MLNDIVEVKPIKDYILFLRFEDGVEGLVDISKILTFEGIFANFKDLSYFSSVTLSKELGTIVWDNGADLSPCLLYSLLAKKVA